MRRYFRVPWQTLGRLNHGTKIAADAVVFGDYPDTEESAHRQELTMIWYRGEIFPKLECYQDSFAVFGQFRDLFDELGKLPHRYLTPHDLCWLLENLGFADMTPEASWKEILVTLQPKSDARSVA